MIKFEQILFDDLPTGRNDVRDHLLSVIADNNLLTSSELKKLKNLHSQDEDDQE